MGLASGFSLTTPWPGPNALITPNTKDHDMTDNSSGNATPPTLRSKRDGRERKVKVWLNEPAQRDLKDAQAMFQALLGRPVTATLAVRRGLDLLAEHLSEIDGHAAVEAEKARLFNHIR